MRPRPYQLAALDAVSRELSWRVSTLLDMATGTGKTFLFGWLPVVLGGRWLVLVHREELLRQATAKIVRVAPDLGVSVEWRESRGHRRHEANLFDLDSSRVVVASKDTICQPQRLARYRPDDFDFVLVDEAHRAVLKNKSYASTLKRFCRPPLGDGRAKLVGASGSLDRADDEALGGLFQSVAYRFGLADAVAGGWLVEPKPRKVRVKDLKLKSLPTSRAPDGQRDVSPAALDRVMRRREYAYSVAIPLLDESEARGQGQGVVFASSGPQAEIQTAVLNAECPGCAVAVLGETYMSREARVAALERFEAGDVRFVVSCDALIEGWDSDRVDIVVPKPSASRARVAQMVGRGTRPRAGCVDVWERAEDRRLAIAASPKPYLSVLDVCGVSDQHSLVNVADIFTGRYTREAPPSARARTDNRPDDLDERRATRAALKALEEERLHGLSVAVDYEVVDGNMMNPARIPAAAVARNPIDHPASERQCRWLESRGLIVPKDLTAAQASAIIGETKAREAASSATDGQRMILARYGLPVAVTRGEAAAVLDRLQAAGWSVERMKARDRSGEEEPEPE